MMNAKSKQELYSRESGDQYEALSMIVRSRRARLAAHPLYRLIGDRQTMHQFMEAHVFAVWDFMCLLKALQAKMTCTTQPWIPTEHASSRAFINEIVVAEESDVAWDGRNLSHLEMYIEAMDESGANTKPIKTFLNALREGTPALEALKTCGAPDSAVRFTTSTLELIDKGNPIEIASSFTLGREVVIPAMFRPLIRRVDANDGVRSPRLRYYFDRHIELDGEHHGELSKAMLCHLCQGDMHNWRVATDAAIDALDARHGLWDNVEKEICEQVPEEVRKKAEVRREAFLSADNLHAPTEEAERKKEGFAQRIIYIVSLVICGAVAFLILGPRPEGMSGQLDVSGLPVVNATLNSLSTLLLIAAFVLIKKGDVEKHKKAMLAAFGVSAAFLVTYVIYHWFKEGPKKYTGDYRGVYLSILLSHIVLAVSILPLSLFALYRGWHMQVAKHVKIAKVAFPIWLYVSVTGVLIYGMLYF